MVIVMLSSEMLLKRLRKVILYNSSIMQVINQHLLRKMLEVSSLFFLQVMSKLIHTMDQEILMM